MGCAAGARGVTVLFFCRGSRAPWGEQTGLPPALEIRSWRPASDGLPGSGPHARENLAWLAFQRLGVFATDGFEELSIWRGERMLHRLVVTPRWRRFPFMAVEDVQIGGLWTDPEVRRVGLASAAIAEAHRRHAAIGRRFWYLVDDGNAPSAALAEACGYRLIGAGRRTRPLGCPALGQFRLDSVTVAMSD
jgi:hypothetical protein